MTQIEQEKEQATKEENILRYLRLKSMMFVVYMNTMFEWYQRVKTSSVGISLFIIDFFIDFYLLVIFFTLFYFLITSLSVIISWQTARVIQSDQWP